MRAARKLIEAQGLELKVKDELAALEKQINGLLRQGNALGEQEKSELRKALAAKDRVIAAYEAEIAVLKKNRWSTWKWIKAAAVGAGVGLMIGAVLVKR